MKLVFIAYNEALEREVVDLLRDCGAEGWTKWTKVYGQGRSSGPHLGTHVWPKANNVIAVVADADTAEQVVSGIREMRKTLSSKGIKAFVLPCEAVT